MQRFGLRVSSAVRRCAVVGVGSTSVMVGVSLAALCPSAAWPVVLSLGYVAAQRVDLSRLGAAGGSSVRFVGPAVAEGGA